jgi:hypothetical protein
MLHGICLSAEPKWGTSLVAGSAPVILMACARAFRAVVDSMIEKGRCCEVLAAAGGGPTAPAACLPWSDTAVADTGVDVMISVLAAEVTVRLYNN